MRALYVHEYDYDNLTHMGMVVRSYERTILLLFYLNKPTVMLITYIYTLTSFY